MILHGAALNAAKIALSSVPDGSSTHQVDQIVMAAQRLHTIERRRRIRWEDQPSDWESVCSKIASYIANKHRVPSEAMITWFIKERS